MFGENFEDLCKEEDEPTNSSASKSDAVGQSTKGKPQAESTGHTYGAATNSRSWNPSEFRKFAGPHHWLEYFPPVAAVSTVK